MNSNKSCPACGGNVQHVVLGGMVQYKCPYCGYTEVPRDLVHGEAAAMNQRFRFLEQANALYAEILNKIAAPQSIKWPDRLLDEDVGSYLNTPIYGMLYAAWLTKGFRSSMTPEVKSVINAVYEPALSLKNRSAVLAVLINLYENSIRQEHLRQESKQKKKKILAISAVSAIFVAIVTSLILLGAHAPNLTNDESGASIHLTKDSIPMFSKLGVSFSVKEHPSTSAKYVDVKSVLKKETEVFTVYDLALMKNGEKCDVEESASFTLPIPEGYDTSCLLIYYVGADKSYSIIPSTVSVEDYTISFNETRFGTYVIAERHPIITFDTADGNETYQDIVTRDTLIPKPETPTRDGYIFNAWLCNDTVWNFNKDTATEDMTLVASWTPIEYYISYESNGGALCEDTVYTVESGTINLPIPSRPGYNFVAWYDNSSLTGKSYKSLPEGSMGDMSLYAKWKYKSAVYQSPYKEITIDASYTKVHDTFSLDDISPFLNSSYNITFTIEIRMYEKYAGYQEIYLCNSNQSPVWQQTKYEYGGSGSANKTESWVTFTVTLSGSKCTNVMHLMYGANGDYSDDWVRSQVKVTATVTEA